jgi:L-threonylcarbamoyladenylate synthase
MASGKRANWTRSSMPVVIAVDPRAPGGASRDALAEAARVLRAGGLVAFPTETVYGLGALAFDEGALARVFAAKGRPVHHPLIAHVEDEARARALAASWPETASRLARAFWPGPLTLVVDRGAHVPAAVSGGASSIAVRVPAHPVALALLAMLGQPIAAPSANRYQGVSPTTAAHVVKELGDRVDLVLDAGPCAAGIESTVVDARFDPPRVLRLGAASLATLRRAAPGLRVRADDAAAEAARASPGMDPRHYAPRARMMMASSRDAAVSLARELVDARGEGGGVAESGSVGLVVHEPVSAGEAEGVEVRRLPNEPSEYARRLYGTLHDLDDGGVRVIVVQAVPRDDEAWWAVADRLERGSS